MEARWEPDSPALTAEEARTRAPARNELEGKVFMMEIDWREDAKCRGTDPETFAPVSDRLVDARPALAICQGCPVREACLDEALAEGDDTTVRGGYTAAQRRMLMRQRLNA